jgi:hypothetical protein
MFGNYSAIFNFCEAKEDGDNKTVISDVIFIAITIRRF